MRVQPAVHGRDHCPGGPDPIPCLPTSGSDVVPFARLWSLETDSVVTLTTGVNTLLTYHSSAISDAAFFSVPGGLDRITVLNKGYYGIRYAFVWAGLSVGNVVISSPIISVSGTTNAAVTFPWIMNSITSTQAETWQARVQLNHAIGVRARQDTGSNKTIRSRMLEVFYIGSFDGSVAYDGSADKWA